MAGPAHTADAVAPLGCDVGGLSWLLAAGSAIGVAEAVGTGEIDAVEGPLSRRAPEVGEVHVDLFLEVDVVVEAGDTVIVVVLCGVGVAFVAADGVIAAVAVHGSEVSGVAAGVEVELVAMATGAGEAAVFIPDGSSVLQAAGAGIAVAVAAEGGAGAVAAVVAAIGVEAVEEHNLEAEGFGDMPGVGGVEAVVAGAAGQAIFPVSGAGMFPVRREVFVQAVGGVASRRRR